MQPSADSSHVVRRMAIQTQKRLLGKVFGRVRIANQTLQFSDGGQIVNIEDVPKAIGDTNVQGYFPPDPDARASGWPGTVGAGFTL